VKVLLEQTDKIVMLQIDGVEIPARIWEGQSESGIPCHAYITMISVQNDVDASEFERELTTVRRPTAPVATIPPTLII
jgi:hypothetical protein